MSKGSDTRERIKAEAMRLFVGHGIDRISVRDIADAVGMKPSNLYAHFASREDLVREMFAEGYADYGQVLVQTLHAAPAGFAARLRAMVERICRLHDEDTTRFRFLLLSQHAGLQHLADTAGEPAPVDVVQGVVQAAMADGEIAPGDPALLTAAIIGIVLQAATFRLYGRLQQDMSAMAEHLAEACLAVALLPRPAP